MPLEPADCWFLTGPTASGKTAVAIELARLLGAEIVSMDSMALYRGMDVGTAKPTADEQRAVPHHLIDIIDPDEDYSLAQYVEAAGDVVREIDQRGRQALFVGGTPLYLKSLLRGIFVGPPADWELRRSLAEQAEAKGPDWLHARLAEIDPASARRLHRQDTRRLIRAIEVYEKTGQPISQLQKQFDLARPADACRVTLLEWNRSQLLERIDARVDAMFAAELIGEVQQLLARHHRLSRTAGQAVGYREVLDHLAGHSSLDETITLVKTRTRQFAKRQLTWFRSLSECRPIAVVEPFNAAAIARTISNP